MINLNSFTPKILVIGDLMIDHYIWGNCERISPEAPVPILKVRKESYSLGGACNVANNLIAFGANVSLCGAIGNDANGEILLSSLVDSNIDISLVFKINGFSTIKKTRLIASSQQMLRVDRECENLIINYSNLLSLLNEVIESYDSVVLSDYNKGMLDSNFTKAIINLANEKNKPILCDPKGDDYSKYSNATLITPNKKEAQIATGIKIDSNESLFLALKKLKTNLKLKYSFITLSEDGMAIFDSDVVYIPTFAREVFDVTGAGDTVVAALAFGISCKLNIYDSASFASHAAALVVGKIGSATVSLGEVLHSMKNNAIDVIDSISVIKTLQKSGKKIVFTNGCFDILHLGHITYLKAAKKLGDILVVGLNSDKSISRIKGNLRPINSQEDRYSILSALEFVDFVIIFDEDTPYELIKLIKPSILVKGLDYKDKEVIGSDIVKDIRLLDFVPDKSSTNVIEKIKRKYCGE